MQRFGGAASWCAEVGWTSVGVMAFGGGWDEARQGPQDSCLTHVGAQLWDAGGALHP